MSLPLLNHPLSSQNHRVSGYEIPSDEQPRIYTTENQLSSVEMDELIWGAYYQVFHQQQMLSSTRQNNLESQLRSGQITVRDFIRGLAKSDIFRRLNYDTNNNYRFVGICVQRILGRTVYNQKETLAWSIVLATQGLDGFIDALVDSQEYLRNFGNNIVPYQQRRILPGRTQGELPFVRMARYGSDYRDKLPQPIMVGQSSFSLKPLLSGSSKNVVVWMAATIAFLIACAYLLPVLGLFPNVGPY